MTTTFLSTNAAISLKNFLCDIDNQLTPILPNEEQNDYLKTMEPAISSPIFAINSSFPQLASAVKYYWAAGRDEQ
jgi:hypothetical protein